MAENDKNPAENATPETNTNTPKDPKNNTKRKSAGWVWILVIVALLSILIIWLIPSSEKEGEDMASGDPAISVTDSANGDVMQVTVDTGGVAAVANDSMPNAVEGQAPTAVDGQSAPITTAAADPQAAPTVANTATPAATATTTTTTTTTPTTTTSTRAAATTSTASSSAKMRIEPIKYGDFSQWVTRTISESKAIGGKEKTLYEIAPTATMTGNNAYTNKGGSPWATSNVYAKVAGITKGSGTVSPANVNGNTMAKMEAKMEEVKVLGIVNMDVMVAGTIFLGQVYEPITSTKGPFSKMEMGVPYTKRPKALVFDYKVDMPNDNTRVKATGLGKKQTLQGRDNAEVYVLLQKRWEDSKGNIHALRVGTGRERYSKTIPLTKGHQLPIHYGDITKEPFYKSYMGLLNGSKAYYAKNSKGKLVPVQEEGWADPNETPTHVLVMCSSSCGEPFVGTEGLTLYIDNIGFGF